MTHQGDIRVEEVSGCLLCDARGEQLYAGLRDRLFGADGVWNICQCPGCRLMWLNPRPLLGELGKIYATYFSHQGEVRRSKLGWFLEKAKLGLYAAVPGYRGLADGDGWRRLGRMLYLFPSLRKAARWGTMHLNGVRKGKLLDVGCGNGHFLFRMRGAGWEVLGVENDRVAVQQAADQYGIRVIPLTLQEAALPEASVDAVTLSHVIEHVHDPVGLLSECRRVLRPGGHVVVVTPNVECWGHRLFRDSWRGLEPPRHLYLFSRRTLQACAQKAGLVIDFIQSSARRAWWMWAASHSIKNKGKFSDEDMTWEWRIGGLVFQVLEELAHYVSENVGEELLLVASR